jgi:hypothetical protein
MFNWSLNLLISALLFLLIGCQGELYNNSELFEATFGEASTTGCTTDSLTGFHTGDGSSLSPFEICDKQQLINLAIKMNQASTYASVANAHFLLTANLDMNGPEEVTYPIGYFAEVTLGDRVAPNNKPFNGVFDGGDFYIDNFVMNLSSKNYVGLFQHLGPSSIVKNLVPIKFLDMLKN